MCGGWAPFSVLVVLILVKEHQDHDSGHPQPDRSCITGLREGDNHESPPGEFATGQFSAEPSRTQAPMCQYSMQRAMGHASAFEPAGLGRIPYRRPEGGSTSVTVGFWSIFRLALGTALCMELCHGIEGAQGPSS